MVQYRVSGATSWTGAASSTNQLKLSNLLPNQDYECQVRVYRSNLEWGVSAISTIHTGGVLFTKVADNGTSMEISWPSLAWATTYTLQYNDPNYPSTWVSATSSALTSVVISPVLDGQDYWVRLRVTIGSTLWGVSNEQKIGRSAKAFAQIENQESGSGANIYPNPFVEQINLEISAKESSSCNWRIYDMTGQVIMSGNQSIEKGNNTLTLDASGLAKGVYVLNVITNNQKQSFRIMKQ